MAINLGKGKNILPATSASVGFGARKILNKLSAVQATDYQAFCQNARKFLLQFVEKHYEWCPSKYPVTRALSSLSPQPIKGASTSVLIKLFDKLWEILVNAGSIWSVDADSLNWVCRYQNQRNYRCCA